MQDFFFSDFISICSNTSRLYVIMCSLKISGWSNKVKDIVSINEGDYASVKCWGYEYFKALGELLI